MEEIEEEERGEEDADGEEVEKGEMVKARGFGGGERIEEIGGR